MVQCMLSRRGAALYLRAEPCVVWVTPQTIGQQLPFVLSKTSIPSLLLAVFPSEPSCCFTCFPCRLTRCLLPFSVSSLTSSRMLLVYFFAAAPLPDITPPTSSFFTEEVPPSELNEICWKLGSVQLSLSSIISCFVFNSSLVEEDNDSFGCDALELDGKQEDIMYNRNMS